MIVSLQFYKNLQLAYSPLVRFCNRTHFVVRLQSLIQQYDSPQQIQNSCFNLLQIVLLSPVCLFKQLVIDAIIQDNRFVVEVFVKQNKKITDYEEESDEERVMNAKLLERLRDMIMTSEIDTEGQGAKSSLRLV